MNDEARKTFGLALKTVQRIDYDEGIQYGLQSIVISQVESQDISAALQTAQMITDESFKSDALGAIAVGQIHLGSGDEGMKTLDTIHVDRSSYLSDAARAYAEVKDLVNFKEIIVRSYFMETSYTICELLPQFYPEKARDIENVIFANMLEQTPN